MTNKVFCLCYFASNRVDTWISRLCPDMLILSKQLLCTIDFCSYLIFDRSGFYCSKQFSSDLIHESVYTDSRGRGSNHHFQYRFPSRPKKKIQCHKISPLPFRLQQKKKDLLHFLPASSCQTKKIIFVRINWKNI